MYKLGEFGASSSADLGSERRLLVLLQSGIGMNHQSQHALLISTTLRTLSRFYLRKLLLTHARKEFCPLWVFCGVSSGLNWFGNVIYLLQISIIN
ncbi:hypothetical protein TNCT_402831 [Trichonephila clavata]|uniref:Uncharacterized protein n=1 Tax=Trichonephila clavata TaxID=2740835 RepID=A0A8X6L142_TRICU|nr:hypothetical protein TNCT_402831 [Trichonephila clavata]